MYLRICKVSLPPQPHPDHRLGDQDRIDPVQHDIEIRHGKAVVKLGYKPTVKFEEGLRATLAWYKSLNV